MVFLSQEVLEIGKVSKIFNETLSIFAAHLQQFISIGNLSLPASLGSQNNDRNCLILSCTWLTLYYLSSVAVGDSSVKFLLQNIAARIKSHTLESALDFKLWLLKLQEMF